MAASGIGPDDVVYDLGAGKGILTQALAERAARVIAVEKDQGLVRHLRARFNDYSNVAVRHTDIQTYVLPRANYVVFANPPFDITSAVIRKLTTAPVPPREAWLMLQREAAERYLGSPAQTLAALQIAPWFAVDVVHRFKRSDFLPAPAVEVVLVRVRKRGPPLVPARESQIYRDFIAAIFTAWRPTIGSSIADRIGARAARRLLATAGVDPHSKPSAVSQASWLALYERFARLDPALRAHVAGAEVRLRSQQSHLTRRHRTRAPRDGLPSLVDDTPLVEQPVLR
ncbi:MAG: rRNA adenine N(6)-methyltransferase family protein [Chloroflexota bacterium]|nr:rRNA adenine N(6)-methyltransferase family protein [Chloroflexota bacterium]